MFKFLSIIILVAHLVHIQARYSECDSLDRKIFERQLPKHQSMNRIIICPNGVKCIEQVDVIDLSERYKPCYDVVPLTIENVTCNFCYDLYDSYRVYTKTVTKSVPFYSTEAQQCNWTRHYNELGTGCDCSD